MHVVINEGNAYTVGKVSMKGNETTKEEVVLRQFRGMDPGERFDRTGQFDRTEKRLKESSLFSDANITLQGDPRRPRPRRRGRRSRRRTPAA